MGATILLVSGKSCTCLAQPAFIESPEDFDKYAISCGCRRVAPFSGKFPESEFFANKSENPTRKAECHISKFRTRLPGGQMGTVLANPDGCTRPSISAVRRCTGSVTDSFGGPGPSGLVYRRIGRAGCPASIARSGLHRPHGRGGREENRWSPRVPPNSNQGSGLPAAPE